VRVGAGNDDGIDIQAAHLVAQRLKVRKSLSTHYIIGFVLIIVWSTNPQSYNFLLNIVM
jgi:hypothetical protein